MEMSRRERIVFLGIIPLAAAITGAVVTVVATRVFASSVGTNVLSAIVADTSMNAQQRLKALELVNANDGHFWSFMGSVLVFMSLPLTALAWAWADKIRGR